MTPSFIYILKCNDGSYYTCHTGNLERRIAARLQNETSEKWPVEIAFAAIWPSREEASLNERKIRRWPKDEIEIFIEETKKKKIRTAIMGQS